MPFQVAPVEAPHLLPTGPIGVPRVNLEKNTKPGSRSPHFNTGIEEGAPLSGKAAKGPLSNGLAGAAKTPLSEEAAPIMDVAAMA